MTISLWIVLRMRNLQDKRCRENQYTHFVFLFKSCRLWNSVEKCGGVRVATNASTVWRMRYAFWICRSARAHAHSRTHVPIRAYTHTQAEKYLIPFAFPRQQWFLERASILCYRYIACRVLFNVIQLGMTYCALALSLVFRLQGAALYCSDCAFVSASLCVTYLWCMEYCHKVVGWRSSCVSVNTCDG